MAPAKSIRRIRTAPAHEVVLEQLRRAIGLGRFLPGEKLPPERSLAEQLGVSRTTLRAALQVLADDDTVEIRRGAHGGIVIRPRGGDSAGRPPKPSEIEVENIFAFRIANERAAGRLAAERRTDRDLRRLEAILDRLNDISSTKASRQNPDNVPRFMAADAEFHLAIAAAGRNPFLIEAIERALAVRFYPLGAVFPALHDDANAGHAEILEAIDARNPDRADREISRHIGRTLETARTLLGRR